MEDIYSNATHIKWSTLNSTNKTYRQYVKKEKEKKVKQNEKLFKKILDQSLNYIPCIMSKAIYLVDTKILKVHVLFRK